MSHCLYTKANLHADKSSKRKKKKNTGFIAANFTVFKIINSRAICFVRLHLPTLSCTQLPSFSALSVRLLK